MQISHTQRGKLPNVSPPEPFSTDDGRFNGWQVRIPGGRSLATPAVSGGRVFLGGGFGSYEFYAFDADTGQLLWQYQTNDDGPTAAVVEDDLVVFNTESCELEVLTVTGESVWKRWLGDPLMSMPAVGDGSIYMAYPDSKGDRRHYVASFELRLGTPRWKQPINGEIISAPVLADDSVYLTTVDGTLYCFRQADGRLAWKDHVNATSAPVVSSGNCYYSQREEMSDEDDNRPATQTEQCATRSTAPSGTSRPYRRTKSKADWLDHAKRAARSDVYAFSETADAGVGFAGLKGDAKIYMAQQHLGQAHVYGVWSFQGSKPFLRGEHLYSALGSFVQSVHIDTDDVVWKTLASGSAEEEEILDILATPPCLVNGKVFYGTRLGDIHCLAADSGERLWRAAVGEPVIFQPAVVAGRVYIATATGRLVSFETEDPDDDGWLMWGATAAHNGLDSHQEQATTVGAR